LALERQKGLFFICFSLPICIFHLPFSYQYADVYGQYCIAATPNGYTMFKKMFSARVYMNLLHIWLLLLRIAVSLMMLTHGYPKVTKLFSGSAEFADPFGLGPVISLIMVVFAEVVCSFFLIIGLGTRLATLPLLFTMATAVFIIHADHAFQKQEFPLLYALIYFTILLLGPGKYSIDNRIAD
jgi:putative oxidoreductase